RLRPHLTEMPQLVLERALLDRHLHAGVDVLHRAAAADAEMRAGRRDARTARAQHRGGLRDVELRLAPDDLGLDSLAGQRAANEDDLALVARHAVRVEVERFDLQLQRVQASSARPNVRGDHESRYHRQAAALPSYSASGALSSSNTRRDD